MTEEPVMYIIVNSDLKMDKGKMIAQSAHSVGKMLIRLERMFYRTHFSGDIEWYEDYEKGKFAPQPSVDALRWYAEWQKGSYVKIALKAPESFLREMIQKYHPYQEGRNIWLEYTLDEGRTQIEQGSLTTIAFNPAPRSQLPKECLELKLL